MQEYVIYRVSKKSPLKKYGTIAPNLEKNEIRYDISILMYMPIRCIKMVLIYQEMYELWALENPGLKTKDEFCSNTRLAFQ